MDFVVKRITRIGFGKKNQSSPQCVRTWANGTGHTLEPEGALYPCQYFFLCLNNQGTQGASVIETQN
jgi:hypothetical protein